MIPSNIPTPGKILDPFEAVSWQSFFTNLASILRTGNYPVQYPVASLPPAQEGCIAYATNGRKIGEGVGAGTGVPVYYSRGVWRVYSTDAQVLA